MSFSEHKLHRSVGAIRILCNLSCVGIMSWIILYQDAIIDSSPGVVHRFFHTLAQSVSGHRRSSRMPMVWASACMNARRTSYMRRLYLVTDSSGPWDVM